jgi:hypothetical protein
VLVAGATPVEVLLVQRELPILAVAVAVAHLILTKRVPQAVQALSFFATPDQFNISLVAQ